MTYLVLDEEHTSLVLEEAQQHINRLQQQLDEMASSVAEAEAKASADAELRKIFRIADQHRSGFIDIDGLLALGKAADPSLTRQKCSDLTECMDASSDGKVSADEFVEVVQKVLEGLSEASQQRGTRAMGAAAEELAKKAACFEAGMRAKAEAEGHAGREAAARAKAEAETRAEVEKQARIKAEAEAEAEALARTTEAERADMLQSKLDEQAAVLGKALDETQQRCDQLQQELGEAVRARMEAEAKAQAKAEAESMTDEERAELQQVLEVERTRSTELQRLLEFEMTGRDCMSCGQLQQQVSQLEGTVEELKSKVFPELI